MVDLGGVVGGLTNALIPAPKPQAPPPQQHQPPPNPYAQDPYAGAQNPYGRGAPPPPRGGRGAPPPGDPYGRGRGGGGPPRGGGRGAGPGPPPRGGGHPQQPRVAVVEDNIPRPNLNDPGFLSDDFPKGPPKLYITAEDDEFDVETINAWKEEGFDVNYISMGSGGREYTIKLASLMRQNLGPCETYGIVAYGDAAAICLEFFHSLEKNSEFRLCCLIAYYPTRVPDPQARFPGGVRVLVHLAEGNEFIGVAKRDQMAGIQGRRRIVKRQIPQGVGVGRFIKWAWRAYAYDADGGFAEHDLDEYDKVNADLAWTRSLALARRAFRRELELEKVVDEHTQGKFFGRNLKQTMSVFTNKHEPHVTHAPTMTGGVGAEELEDFYGHFFIGKNPPSLQATLLSRTVGVNRVVDELHLSFKHTQEMDWILPGIPPTKKTVEVILVSIITLSGGKLRHEHVYWDQASVLVQIGLLDPKVVPDKAPFKDVKRLPVVGKKAAKRMLDGNENGDEGEADNELIPGWYESSDEEEEEEEDSGSDYEVEEVEDEDDIVEEADEEPAQPPPPANPRSNFKNTRVDSVSDEDRPRGSARRAEPEGYADHYEVNEVEEPRQPARPTRPFGKAADDRSRGPPRRPEPVYEDDYEDEEPEPPRQAAKAPARAFGKSANAKSQATPKPAPAPVPEPEYDEVDDDEVEEPPPRQPSRAPEKSTRAPSRSADDRPSRSNSPVTAKKPMAPAKAQRNAPPARRDPEERPTRPMKSESDQKPAAPAKVPRPTAPAKKEPDEKPRRASVSAPAKKVAAPAKVPRPAPSAGSESSERPARPVAKETDEKAARPARKEPSAARPERPPSRSIPARAREARPETPPATPARREAPKTERPRRPSRPEKHEPTPQPTPEPEEVEEETPLEEDQYEAEEDEYEVEPVEEEEAGEEAEDEGDDEVEVAGTINEDGEIIDDEGQAVGRVTEGDPADMVGLVVTLDGDVLDEEGHAVGRAEPYDDVEWDEAGGAAPDDDEDMEIEEA